MRWQRRIFLYLLGTSMTQGTDRSHSFWPPPSHPCLCPILKFGVLCVRPIGLSHHLMEGKGELTPVAMLSQPKEAAELIKQAATKAGSQ